MVASDSASQSGDVAPRARAQTVIVGRAHEQALLKDELQAAIDGVGRVILLGGEAGIGKTSLARELARDALARGVRVMRGHSYDLVNTPPFGPWIELFQSAARSGDIAVPPVALTTDTNVRVVDQAALFREVRRFFADLSQSGPLLLVLEDLHWADSASVDLLRSLSVAFNQWPILVIVTYRIDELSRHHPFYQQMPALVREAQAVRLNLGAIDSQALRDLVQRQFRLSSTDEVRLVAYLNRHADGNPFFAVELIRALEEAGLLRRGESRSSLGELDRIVVPTLLRQVIDSRVARLGEATRERLEIAAIIGQEVPIELWATIANIDEQGLIEIVEQAVASDLLEADPTGTRVRFVHALTREALYTGILALRRRLWHRQVAEAMARDQAADPDEVALHFQLAGDQRAADWLIRAGDRAVRVYAWVMGTDRLRSAAALLKDVPEKFEIYRELVFRAAYLIRFADAEVSLTTLDEVKRLAEHANDRIVYAEATHITGTHLCYVDRFREGIEAMAKGLEIFESPSFAASHSYAGVRFWFASLNQGWSNADSIDDARVIDRFRAVGIDARRCALPWFVASSGRLHPALDMVDQCLSPLDPGQVRGGWIPGMVGFALHGRAVAFAALGRADEARAVWNQARAGFADVNHFMLIAFTLLNELRDVGLTYLAMNPGMRRQLAGGAEAALARAGGALRPGVSPRLARLGCYLLDGRWDEMDQILNEMPPPGNSYLRREMTAAVATLALYRGQRDIVWAQILSVLTDGAATEPGDCIHQEGLLLQRFAVEQCLADGDLASAEQWLDAHDRWLDWSGSLLGRADGLVSRGRWHLRAGQLMRARSLGEHALIVAATPVQPLVQLAAHRLLGEVACAAADFPTAQSHLAMARSLAEACDAPFERAGTLLSMAELHIATRSTPEAESLLDDVYNVCAPLHAVPILDRIANLRERIAAKAAGEGHPAGLTQREVDVLRLVAQHKTDKEIAEELFVSPRTVQTHVANILHKLGVEHRRAAAAEAQRLDIA